MLVFPVGSPSSSTMQQSKTCQNPATPKNVSSAPLHI